MELRSKSQREAVGPDAADRDLSGEAVIRLAHDPSPPVLSRVRLQTTPVPSDSNPDDAEQRQEHAHTTPESGDLTIAKQRNSTNHGSKSPQAVASKLAMNNTSSTAP